MFNFFTTSDSLDYLRDLGSQWQWTTCNCACQTCLDGGCCLLRPSVTPVTYTTTTTRPLLPLHEHDYRKLNTKRLFCRTCGDTKDV